MTSSPFSIYIIGTKNGALTHRLYSKLQELELPVLIFPAAAESIEHAAARGVKKIVLATEPTIEQDVTARIILAARRHDIALLPVGTRDAWEAIIPISMPELFDTQVWAPEDAWEKEIPAPETPKVKMVYGVRVTQHIPDISSMIPIVDLAGTNMNDSSDPATEVCRADKRQNILSTVSKVASGSQSGLIKIFSLTLALLLVGAAAFYYFSNICQISEEEKLKANYKDSTYRAMSECLCDDCQKHLTRISNEFHTCRISDKQKNDAQKDDDTYKAMRQCVEDRDCVSCKKHLTRIDEEFKKCRISEEQKKAAKKDDDTYKAMKKCVNDRNCESCIENLARIDETAEQEAAEQAQKEKEEKEAREKACSLSEALKMQRNTAKKGDDTYKAMKKCSENKSHHCLPCAEAVRRSDSRATCKIQTEKKANPDKETYQAMKECANKGCADCQHYLIQFSDPETGAEHTCKPTPSNIEEGYSNQTYNKLKANAETCQACKEALKAMCPNSVTLASPDEINREDSLHHMKTFLCEDCRAALANLCTVTDETRQKALEGDAAAKEAVQKCADIRNCSDCANTMQQAEGGAAEQTCVNQWQEAPTEDALIDCLKENQCSHCREKLAAQNPALIQCNIDPKQAQTAAKDDETYEAMQTCVAEKQCPACKKHLKRIDDEKRQEQNRACTVGDGGDAESWWNCVVERNCEQCWKKLKANAESDQKEQADKPKS